MLGRGRDLLVIEFSEVRSHEGVSMARNWPRTWRFGAVVLLAASMVTSALPAQAVPVPEGGLPAATVNATGPRPVERTKLAGSVGTQGAYWQIRNKSNGDCIYPDGGAGTYVYANSYACEYYLSDTWSVEELADGTVRLRNWYFDTCAFADGTTNNSYVKTWNCGDYRDQRWVQLWDNDYQYFRLKNVYSGLCMVHRFADHGPVQQYKCDAYQDQRWDMVYSH
jgi:hypothetical protein